MLNQFQNYCLNPYILLILSVVVIVASIVDDRLSVEIFILFIFYAISILLAVRIRLYRLSYAQQITKCQQIKQRN